MRLTIYALARGRLRATQTPPRSRNLLHARSQVTSDACADMLNAIEVGGDRKYNAISIHITDKRHATRQVEDRRA